MTVSDLHRRIIASKKPLLLDAFPNASAAYSLRKLRSAYTGNCIEVRRSSDNTTQNIGFVNNVLDIASLLSFVGAGNGFVMTWYDQSGNSRNGIQTDNARQPQIVSSGNVIFQASKPSINFDDVNDSFAISSGLTGLSRLDAFAVKNSTSSAHITFTSTDGAGNFSWVAEINSNSIETNQWKLGPASLYVNGQLQTPTTRGQVYTLLNGYKLETTINGGTINWIAFRIAGYALQYAFGGTMQEIILYPSNQSANRTPIESNINSFYNIY